MSLNKISSYYQKDVSTPQNESVQRKETSRFKVGYRNQSSNSNQRIRRNNESVYSCSNINGAIHREQQLISSSFLNNGSQTTSNQMLAGQMQKDSEEPFIDSNHFLYLQTLDSFFFNLSNNKIQVSTIAVSEEAQKAYINLKNALQHYESQSRIRAKEVAQLNQLNYFLNIALKKKDDIIQSIVNENVDVKSKMAMLERHFNSMKNQEKQLLIKKKIEVEMDQIDILQKQKLVELQNQIIQQQQSLQTIDRQQNKLERRKSTKLQISRGDQQRNFTKTIIISGQKDINAVFPELRPQISQQLSPQIKVPQEQLLQQSQTIKMDQSNSPLVNGKQSPLRKQKKQLDGKFSPALTNNNIPNSQNQPNSGGGGQVTQLANFQNQLDYSLILSLLNINLADDAVRQQYLENIFLQFLNQYFQSEATLQSFLQSLDNSSRISKFYDSIITLKRHNEIQIGVILNLKKLILSINQIKTDVDIFGAFQQIMTLTNQLFKCEQTYIFLIDKKDNHLWAKNTQFAPTRKIMMGAGVSGSAAKIGQTINIFDANKDSRSQKEMEVLANYNIRNFLAGPIFASDMTNVIGVVESVNKIGGHFTKDDEAIMVIITIIANIILRNCLYITERLSFQNSLSTLLEVSINLNKCRSIASLLQQSQQLLEEKFDLSIAKVFYYDKIGDQLVHYEKSGEQRLFEKSLGIVGLIFQEQNVQVIESSYTNSSFNSQVDIDTNMPILCLPIQKDKSGQTNPKGVIQVVNSKGISSLLISDKSQVNSISNNFKLTMMSFSNMLAIMIENFEEQQQQQEKSSQE